MSGRIPPEFIDELMSRVDIVELIDSRVPLKKTGKEYVACCPFHGEKTPSFTVSPTKQFYHCFGCGAHGTALGFLMNYEHMGFIDAVQELARQTGLEVSREARPQQSAAAQQNQTDLYELLERVSVYYRRQLRENPERDRVVSYLKGRGLSGEVAAKFEIGFAPAGWNSLLAALGNNTETRQSLVRAGMLIEKENSGSYDRFRDRVMFPIRDYRGRMIGFGGRVLGDDTPKYLNSPETPIFHKGQELYGLFQARKVVRDLTRILVVEGYMDVVALAQHGIEYAVATLGTAITRNHLERLARTSPEIVFCFDGDRAGRQAAWRSVETALPILTDGLQIRFMFLPEGEDPDTMVRGIGRESFESKIGHSVPFSTFFFENLTRQADIRSMDGRARLIELARPLLVQLPVGAFRHMMITRLAELAQIDASGLAAHLGGGTLTAPRERKSKSSGRPGLSAPSPVRLAIALLLQNPGLAATAGDPRRFEDLEQPGVALLQELLELLQERPHLTSGAILERWREREEGRQLEKIAKWQHMTPDSGVEAEFSAALERLELRLLEQNTERLLQKSRTTGLNSEEKQLLQELIRRQHRTSDEKMV